MAERTSPTFLLTLLEGEAPNSDEDDDRPEHGSVIAGRYVVQHELGSGGFGEVWVARDRVRDQKVAIKLVPGSDDRERQRARREVNALRWLRLPGVVRMHDEGRWRGAWFIVMDLVDGRHFPGQHSRATWEELRHPTMRLLEVLAGVHRAGVVHRDLKPANVLLIGDEPLVLDFGLARGKAITSEAVRSAEGTPRYAAPEQLLRRETDGRCDLYAVGVMLFEALSGRNPHGAPAKVSALVQARLLDPAPPLGAVAPEVPAEVADLVDRMLARNRERRPASALACLEALGGSGALMSTELSERLPEVMVDEVALRALFQGPDAFLHLREDGARVLWERTGGQPDRIRSELEGWLRGGLAKERDGLVELDRSALQRLDAGLRLSTVRHADPHDRAERELLAWLHLAWPDTHERILDRIVGGDFDLVLRRLEARGQVWRLPDGRLAAGAPVEEDEHWSPAGRADAHVLLARVLPQGSEGRLRHLVAGDGDPRDVIREAREAVEELVHAGRLERAEAVVGLALGLAQERGDVKAEHELLVRRADLAFCEESAVAVEELLYLLGRSAVAGRDLGRLEGLARGGRAALGGEAERALALLDGLGGHEDEVLEGWRQGFRAFAAGFLGGDRAGRVLEEMRPWAEEDPVRLAKWQGWMGNLQHRRGRFSEAAELHQLAAKGKKRAGLVLSSTLNAAMSYQDGLQLEKALSLALEARARAASIRHARYEVTAAWILRTVGYRLDEAGAPQPDLVDAADRVAPVGAACIAASEAALAWRSGDTRLAWKLARRAEQAFSALGLADGAALMLALAWTCGEPPGDLDALASEVKVPSLAVQTLALLAELDPVRAPRLRGRILDLVRGDPELASAPRHVRMDVLSLDEAMGLAEIPR